MTLPKAELRTRDNVVFSDEPVKVIIDQLFENFRDYSYIANSEISYLRLVTMNRSDGMAFPFIWNDKLGKTYRK